MTDRRGRVRLPAMVLGSALLAALIDIDAQAGKIHEIVIAQTPVPEPGEEPPAYYRRIVRAKIAAAWNRPPLSQPVVVRFTIEPDGRISALKIEKSSGDSWDDDEAIHIIRSAQPFPPLPETYSRALIRLELK
jgi:TonB family protein